MKATKKQTTVNFIRWNGDNLGDVIKFTGIHESAQHFTWDEYFALVKDEGFKIFTGSGAYIVPIGHVAIKGQDGSVWPCEYNTFIDTYIIDSEDAATRKPVEIDFVRLTSLNIKEAYAFVHGEPTINSLIAEDRWYDYENIVKSKGLTVQTMEGESIAMIGDVIIKGINGEFYPAKYDSFKSLYDF